MGWCLSRKMRRVGERDKEQAKGRAFQAEGRVGARALKQVKFGKSEEAARECGPTGEEEWGW